MKRLGIALAAVLVLAGGATLAYAAQNLIREEGTTLTGCLRKNGDVSDVAVGREPRKACKKGEREVQLGNGDVTKVSAGAGLGGGGAAGDVTLTIIGSYRLPQGCTSGDVPGWNGQTWACGDAKVVQLAAGDAHCANGGVQILIGLSQPAYACNGAAGKDGQNGKDGRNGADGTGVLRSPNGLYTITISNAGIRLKGPNGGVEVDFRGGHVTGIGGTQ